MVKAVRACIYAYVQTCRVSRVSLRWLRWPPLRSPWLPAPLLCGGFVWVRAEKYPTTCDIERPEARLHVEGAIEESTEDTSSSVSRSAAISESISTRATLKA